MNNTMPLNQMTKAQLCLLLVVVSFVVQTTDAATFSTKLIAVSGASAPDGNGTFSSFNAPLINDAGQVLFRAELAGTSSGPSDATGLFRSDGTNLVEVVRSGQLAPGGNGSFSSFNTPAFNESGQVAFSASLMGTVGGDNDNQGVFIYGDGPSLAQVVRTGHAAPDGNGVFSSLPPNVSLNDSGQSAFTATLTGTVGGASDRSGIFIHTSGTPLAQAVRAGQSSPDGNGNFRSFDQFFQFNNAGTAAFLVTLVNTLGGENDNSGVYRGDGSTIIQIIRKGQSAPDGHGTLAIATIAGEKPLINDSGQIVVGVRESSVIGPSLVRISGDSFVHLVTYGDPAPDGNGTFDTGFSNPVLNNAGQVAFSAILEGTSGDFTDNIGLYRSDGSSLIQLARADQTVPDGNGQFSAFSRPPRLNSAGQVAFLSSLKATTGGTTDDIGLFLFDDAAGLLTIARKGQMLLGSTISALKLLEVSTSGDSVNPLNDVGQLAYQFTLADGRSGIAIASLVPEPGSCLFITIGMLTSATFVRSRRIV